MNNKKIQIDSDSINPVTITILYRAKQGKEQDFERALAEMTDVLGPHSGHYGIKVIRPLDHTHPEYRIIFTFISIKDYDQWCESEEHKQWLSTIESLTDGDPIVNEVDGLEVWLNIPRKNMPRPSRHKMAVVTYLSIFPLIAITSTLLGPILKPIPFLPRIMLSTLIVVIIACYFVLPFMTTKLFAKWLNAPHKNNTQHSSMDEVTPNPYIDLDV